MRAMFIIMGVIMMVTVAGAKDEKEQKFYITGLKNEKPIVSYGKNRFDALNKSSLLYGITIWTEEEYQKMKKALEGAYLQHEDGTKEYFIFD